MIYYHSNIVLETNKLIAWRFHTSKGMQGGDRMFEVSIPKITDEEMMERYKKIKPVVTVDGKLYYLRDFALDEIRGIAYLRHLENNLANEVKEGELTVWENHDFSCLHAYGYYDLFKPSVGEVLSQIDEKDIPFIKAFEIIRSSQIEKDFQEDSLTSIIFNKGYHISKVRLYC